MQLILGLPKFSSELTQRTRTSRTELMVLFCYGSVWPLTVVLVLSSGLWVDRGNWVWTSSNWTFVINFQKNYKSYIMPSALCQHKGTNAATHKTTTNHEPHHAHCYCSLQVSMPHPCLSSPCFVYEFPAEWTLGTTCWQAGVVSFDLLNMVVAWMSSFRTNRYRLHRFGSESRWQPLQHNHWTPVYLWLLNCCLQSSMTASHSILI